MLTSTTSCRRNAAATSRRGSPAHPEDAARVQSWRAMAEALHAQIRFGGSTRRCRSGSRSSGWCDSRADGSTARSRRRWRRSSPAAASAGSRAARRQRPPPSRVSRCDALDAHRLYVVEVRHPVEVPGSERTHLQQWLTKRCGWDVRAPELDGGRAEAGRRTAVAGSRGSRVVPDV